MTTMTLLEAGAGDIAWSCGVVEYREQQSILCREYDPRLPCDIANNCVWLLSVSGGNLHVVTAEAKQLGRRQTGLVFTPLTEPAPVCHHTEQPPCHFVQTHKEN